LTSSETDLLRAAIDTGREFFSRDLDSKLRCSSPDLNHGYRPLGKEYSISADRPDLNECFVIWNDRTDFFGHPDEVEALARAWAEYRRLAASVIHSTVDAIAEHFVSGNCIDFETASYLQMNGYCDPTNERDLLQDIHEDGHAITLHYASGPGLEIRLDGEIRPVVVPCDTLLLMPGSVMTALTDGQIPPLYHQVRNLYLTDRVSLMYFVNPALDRPVLPWTAGPGKEAIDLRETIRSNPSMFGLVDVPVL
jgi:isopenicillin N synthase-like dioxygenase